MKKLLLSLFLLLSTTSLLFAQDMTVDELLGESEPEVTSQDEIEEIEQERVENIENELNISIPEYTDNPSHIITFRDPSEDQVGVEIDIDESGYETISSPYSLPSLSIGKHRLKFRFVDSIGATKVLEYEMVVIPRPPILKAPTFEDNSLILSGTGLANSEIILTLSVGAYNDTQIADIDGDGNWRTSISFDTVSGGIYTIYGYTRKAGYASNPSEPAVMEYGSEGVIKNTSTDDGQIYFSFKELSIQDLPSTIINNPDLLITVISFLLLGIILTTLFFTVLRSNREKIAEKEVSDKINNGSGKEEKTLRELFGHDEEKKEEKTPEDRKKKVKLFGKRKNKKKNSKKSKEKKEEKSEKDEVKKEKIFTKRDFLKDFKKFDPDTDSGKEKSEPKDEEKKEVIVTLTSKVDE
jgi:hypothetical protein